MFFSISQVEQAVHNVQNLRNPLDPAHPMVLGIYRTHSRTALFNVYSKKAFAQFYDTVDRKKLANRHWTPEMKHFARQKIEETSKPPYIFRMTIVGWIFITLMVATLGLIIYESTKPPIPKSAAYVAMEQAPKAGDIYFGRFEGFKESGQRIASELGFGWFQVVKVEGDQYYMAKSTEMSKTHKPAAQLNSTSFESEATPVKITEQAGYMINMKAMDGKLEIYLTDKK